MLSEMMLPSKFLFMISFWVPIGTGLWLGIYLSSLEVWVLSLRAYSLWSKDALGPIEDEEEMDLDLEEDEGEKDLDRDLLCFFFFYFFLDFFFEWFFFRFFFSLELDLLVLDRLLSELDDPLRWRFLCFLCFF